MTGGTSPQRGLWLDPRTKILLLLLCIFSAMIAPSLYAALCNRKIQFLLRRIELLTMQSCRGRLIAHLLEQQDEVGVVKITGSREDLARRLGVSRAALFRELSALQSMGTVSVDGNSITVEDRPLLEELLYHPSNTK